MNTEERIKSLVKDQFGQMVEMRRHLHMYPEVSYKEKETTAYIISKLEEIGIWYDRPLETGCVGVLKGGIESDRVVALRADIDALAMTEEGEIKKSFMSRYPGAAHCCGHDAHTANLLGAAKILHGLRDEIEGTILFIFQPGEEKLPGGGRLLCETGYLQQKKVTSVYGLHTSPTHAPGTLATRVGPLMGSPDEFELSIFGKGGHAARPHEAVDPIVLAAQFVNAAQTIVSRNVDPTEAAVVTIGKIEGGTAHNIIPEKVSMLGTVRTLSAETADLIAERLEALVKGITSAAGTGYEFAFNKGYPVVHNSEVHARKVLDLGTRLFSGDSVIEMERPVMAGEDFAFYQQHFPGAFFFVGSGSPETESTYVWHHPRYNVDDRFFLTAAPLMVMLGLEG